LTKLVVALSVACIAVACARTAEPIDFDDTLTGPASLAWDIPFQKYRLTPEGLLRSRSGSGTDDGTDRPVARTVSGAYLSRDFVFDVDVTIPNGDIAFVGFGDGRNNPAYFNEPTDAVLFRIHNLPRLSIFEIDAAIADRNVTPGNGEQHHFREKLPLATYTSGKTMRFRIVHQGGQVTLSVPSIPDVSITFDRAKFAGLFDRRNSHLFLANSSQGTTFRNVSLRRP
jgi:hypothetical protein